MAKVGKTSRYRKYQDGMWIKSRYVMYRYWYKFLQYAEQDDARTVDWSKYDGWGGANLVLSQRFETWWKMNWKELFAVQNEGDTARYELSNRQIRAGAVRVALLVYEHRHLKSGVDVQVALMKRYKNLESLDADKVLEAKRIKQFAGRYRKLAEKLLDDVCDGKFG
jgi:hypothetical protein